MVYSCRDRDTRVPQNDSDDLRAVEFNSTAWKLIILISYTLKDTQEGSAVMPQVKMKLVECKNTNIVSTELYIILM